MNLFGIKERAEKECGRNKRSIIDFIAEFQGSLVKRGMDAGDCNVPLRYRYAIEGIADSIGVPCRHITGCCFSIATSYSALLKHEEER